MQDILQQGIRFIWEYTWDGELGWLAILNETSIDCMITVKEVIEESDEPYHENEGYKELMTEAWSNCQRRSFFKPNSPSELIGSTVQFCGSRRNIIPDGDKGCMTVTYEVAPLSNEGFAPFIKTDTLPFDSSIKVFEEEEGDVIVFLSR